MNRAKKLLITQILIVVILIVSIITISALTFDNGIIKEEPTLSLDESSENYYMNVLNNEDIVFSCQEGVGHDLAVKEFFPNAKIENLINWSDMMVRCVYGKCDAFFAEELDREWILNNNPTLYCLEEPTTTANFSLAFSKTKEGAELVSKFNAFFARAKEEGRVDGWINKWKDAYTSDNGILLDEVTFSDDSELLPIVIIADWPPFIFPSTTNNGEPTGIFMEYVNHFCAENGYRPDYSVSSSIDAALMGLSSGTYKFLVTGIVPTKEKEESMYFTDTICSDSLLLFTRVTKIEGIDPVEYSGQTGFFTYLGNSLYKNLIYKDRWKMLVKGFKNTLILSFSSAILGTLLGGGIYYLYSRNNLVAASIGRLYINIFQRMPSVLLLLLMCYVVFGGTSISGLVVCIITFALSFSANVSEMLRSGVESIPKGQENAALALGFTKFKAFIKIILPQVIRVILPVYKGLIITLILETSIAGFIAVEDLTKMSDQIRINTFEPLFPMLISALIYFVITTLMGVLIINIEKKTDPLHRRRLPKWVEEIRQGENN